MSDMILIEEDGPVLVTTKDENCFFGYMNFHSGGFACLKNARAYRFDGGFTMGNVLFLAANGPCADRVSPKVDSLWMMKVRTVMPVNKETVGMWEK